MKETKAKNQKGITLIALIITIIVMLILVGVTINIATGNGGIFNTAKNAAKDTTNRAEEETLLSCLLPCYNKETGKYDLTKLSSQLPSEWSYNANGEVTTDKGNTIKVNEHGIVKQEQDSGNWKPVEQYVMGQSIGAQTKLNPTITKIDNMLTYTNRPKLEIWGEDSAMEAAICPYSEDGITGNAEYFIVCYAWETTGDEDDLWSYAYFFETVNYPIETYNETTQQDEIKYVQTNVGWNKLDENNNTLIKMEEEDLPILNNFVFEKDDFEHPKEGDDLTNENAIKNIIFKNLFIVKEN